jgi:hypothetical protein
MNNIAFFGLVGFTVVCFLIFFQRIRKMGDRSFPTSEYIQGFAKVKGVPNKGSKSYFSSTEEAIRRCRENPFCVGVSNQRLFLVEKELKKGETVYTEKGQSGESHAYVKDAYPTVFL